MRAGPNALRPYMTSRLRPCGGVPISRPGPHPHRRTRMPTSTRSPSHHGFTGSAELNAMVERVAPAILGLLADGVPRRKPAIVAALAGQHDKQDVANALIRLAVTGRVEETGGRYGRRGSPQAERVRTSTVADAEEVRAIRLGPVSDDPGRAGVGLGLGEHTAVPVEQ